MRTIAILLVDEHTVVRRGLRALLEAEPGWEVVGEASNTGEAVAQATQLRPDVGILDINIPTLDRLDTARLMLKAVPDMRVMVVAAYHTEEMFARALTSGVRGYLVKADPESRIVAAIKALMQGRTFFSPVLSEAREQLRYPGRKAARPHLTVREAEILRLLAEGKSNKEIAGILSISPRTVEKHRAQIMHRLGLRSFSELVRYAIRNGMAEP